MGMLITSFNSSKRRDVSLHLLWTRGPNPQKVPLCCLSKSERPEFSHDKNPWNKLNCCHSSGIVLECVFFSFFWRHAVLHLCFSGSWCVQREKSSSSKQGPPLYLTQGCLTEKWGIQVLRRKQTHTEERDLGSFLSRCQWWSKHEKKREQLNNFSACYQCMHAFTCLEGTFEREGMSQTKADPHFFSFTRIYNTALEKCGPVKQHKRIGAQIPLD